MTFAPSNYRILYVTYKGVDPYRRIERHELQGNATWIMSYITDNLPAKHVESGSPVEILAFAGDGHSDTVAYVGTAKGVFRGEAACGSCTWNWMPYNSGLPLAAIYDLEVDYMSKDLRAVTYGRGAWSVITGP
jgi:hypothetical protein